MRPALDRRQFLKLASLASLSALSPRRVDKDTGAPNVIVVVFDAWSAENMSLYGYQRKTTPLIEQLAEHAVVYHQHYAAGTWTIPGAASLMTGRYPWTHRATSAAQLKIANPNSKHLSGVFQRWLQHDWSDPQCFRGALPLPVWQSDQRSYPLYRPAVQHLFTLHQALWQRPRSCRSSPNPRLCERDQCTKHLIPGQAV